MTSCHVMMDTNSGNSEKAAKSLYISEGNWIVRIKIHRIDIPPEEVLSASALDGKPDPLHKVSGGVCPEPNPGPLHIAERRLLFIATLSCDALKVKGRIKVPVINPDGFAKIFVTEQTLGPPDTDFIGEYVGWAENKEANYHVDIQLYE